MAGRLPQNAVEARLTGQICSLIRERRDDLRGRQAGKFRSADKVEHAFALGLAQRIGRRRTRSVRAPIRLKGAALLTPGAYGEAMLELRARKKLQSLLGEDEK